MKNKRDCSFLPFRFAIKRVLLYNIMKCNLEEYAMNVIGEIGNFIMIYQEPLQGLAIGMLAITLVIGGMVCVGKAIANAGKKRKILEQISETVLEINDNVKSLKEKRTEVIYIDGRLTPESGTTSQQTVEETSQPAAKSVEEEDSHQKEEVPEEEMPAVKYFSRDCAIAKDGRKYTKEELHAQIRD